MLNYALLVFKGMVYGVTNLLPGIGGGLILLVMGIYEQFVDHVGNLFLDLRSWKQHLAFLIPMGLGAGIGMVAFASLINWLMDLYPAPAMFLFMGLVVGTIPAVLRMHSDMHLTRGRAVALLCGMVVVVLFKWAESHSVSAGWVTDPAQAPGFIYYLVSNFVAGGASVTPGMDGSYIWMLAGIYDGVMGAISSVKEIRQVLGSGGLSAAMAGIQWAALLSTGIGAVAGIIIISKLIDTAIKRAPAVTYYAVLGLVVASVYGLWPKSMELGQASVVVMVLAFIVGAALTWFLGRKEAEKGESAPAKS